jgi:hypothetical protein
MEEEGWKIKDVVLFKENRFAAFFAINLCVLYRPFPSLKK